MLSLLRSSVTRLTASSPLGRASSLVGMMPTTTAIIPLGIRFKSRGNTYQPNTLKRKRTFGFLARLRSRTGLKILKRRMLKNRRHLSH